MARDGVSGVRETGVSGWGERDRRVSEWGKRGGVSEWQERGVSEWGEKGKKVGREKKGLVSGARERVGE